MRKRRTIIIWIVSFITIIGIGLFLYRGKLISLLLDTQPREPKNQTETTYNIGWWSHQDGLAIDEFDIKIIDSRLSLFNSRSLISYTIQGKMTDRNNWEPYLKKIHISERFVVDSTSRIGTIELTPVVGVKENDQYNGEQIKFKTTNELLIESFHWGNNKLILKCGQIQKEIELKQRK
jgi:hypothetical protein